MLCRDIYVYTSQKNVTCHSFTVSILYFLSIKRRDKSDFLGYNGSVK